MLIEFGTFLEISLIAFFVILCGYSYFGKYWIVFAFSISFLIRAAVAAILYKDLQYEFVIDSLKYDQDAWTLTRAWISGDKELFSNAIGFEAPHLYAYFMAWIYYVVGHSPYFISLINALTACCSGLALISIIDEMTIDKSLRAQSRKVAFALITFYPSYMIWSTTNTKDPITLFVLSIIVLFALRAIQHKDWHKKLFYFALSLLLIPLLLNLRFYLPIGLGAAMVFSSLLYFLTKFFKLRHILLFILVFVIACVQVYSYLQPEEWSAAVTSVAIIRQSFSNRFLDFYAQSSFLLDVNFDGVIDLLKFIPQAIAHYFYAPFPWQIKNWTHLLGFFEALLVMILTRPTWRGIKYLYQERRGQTLFLLCLGFTFVLGQSFLISNMGTIFRHRSVTFFLLMPFTAIGFYSAKTKNSENFLKA